MKLVEKVLQISGISIECHKEGLFILRFIKMKSGHKSNQTLGISYTRAREIFLEKLRSVESEGQFWLAHGR